MHARQKEGGAQTDPDAIEGMSPIDIDDERQKLSSLPPVTLIDYIKSSLDILISLRIEDALFDQEQHYQLLQEYKSRGGHSKKNRLHHHGPKKEKKRGRGGPSGGGAGTHSDDEEEEEDYNYINSSRGGHGAPQANLEARQILDSSLRSASQVSHDLRVNHSSSDFDRAGGPDSSIVSSRDGNGSGSGGSGPPKVYEELIQILEGDVRKHIRIEQ